MGVRKSVVVLMVSPSSDVKERDQKLQDLHIAMGIPGVQDGAWKWKELGF